MPGMGPVDSGFLLVESREHPMHVGGLQLFRPPEGESPAWLRDQLSDVEPDQLSHRFRLRPAGPVGLLGNFRWQVDEHVDLDHHVRRSAVPSPGRLRELFELTSRWQGSLLDRHRPLWEVHVVEGLDDGRIAVFSKVHHALADGVSALHLMQRACSPDPEARDCVPPFAQQPTAPSPDQQDPPSSGGLPLGPLRGGAELLGELASLGPNSLKVAYRSLRDTGLATPFDAPRTILNGSIGGSRRFVAQSFEMDRFRRVAKACEVSFNDVVLAVCSGALRQYLGEMDQLPPQSLTAMCPVNLRRESPQDARSGNEIGAMIASLATDVTDPLDRLEVIHESTTAAKRTMGSLSPLQVLLMSGYNIAGLGLSMVPGYNSIGRPPFNVIISNVPGPRKQLYFNGAHLEGTFPASIPVDGLAMNITLVTYDDQVDVGITACRRSAPSVQRMIHHMEDSLADLEAVID